MSAGCCNHQACGPRQGDRRLLWAALGINAAMFAVEIVAGIAAGSASLQADALDFLGDAANYALSLSVLPLALGWRARAALLKGMTMGAFGLWVLAGAAWHAISGTVPQAETMGAVGLLALAANVAVALMLFRFRRGDSNMRSVWICSRNDAIGNVAVLLAAAGVAASGSGWPDLMVALIMAGLALSGAWQVVRHALAELRSAPRPVAAG